MQRDRSEIKTPLSDRLARVSAIIQHIYIREDGILDLESQKGTTNKWKAPARKYQLLLDEIETDVHELDKLVAKMGRYLNAKDKEKAEATEE